MKFDPQTGKPLWTTERSEADGYDEGEETFLGYKVEFGTDDNEAFVCLFVVDDTYSNGGSDSAMVKIPEDFAAQKAKMKADLGELWKEKNFGLWTVLYCSY